MAPRLGYTKRREARIAELEGQQKPPAYGLKEGKAPRWVKANRPARPKGERKRWEHSFARRSSVSPHGGEPEEQRRDTRSDEGSEPKSIQASLLGA